MRKLFQILLAALLVAGPVLAQSPVAQFMFEDAEAFFAEKEYAKALEKLEQAEREFGRVNPPILYLRITSRNELLKGSPTLDFANLERLRQECAYYLENFGPNEALREQAREIYRVLESLKGHPISKAEFLYPQKNFPELAALLEKREELSPREHYLKIVALGRTLASVEHADELEREIEAYKKQCAADGREAEDLKEVEQILGNVRLFGDVRSAEQLYADAMFYLEGSDGPRDFGLAYPLLIRAAELGYVKAMDWVALLHLHGFGGIAEDHGAALDWYLRAAEAGDREALRWLNSMLRDERYKTLDFVARFEKAADSGSAEAMALLGMAHEHGRGVREDHRKARDFYLQAAEKGSPLAMARLGALYGSRTSPLHDYTLAREWYQKAHAAGSTEVAHSLALIYHYGHGVPVNFNTAREWYEIAAEESWVAMSSLAQLYERGGPGLPANAKLAREWREKAEAARTK